MRQDVEKKGHLDCKQRRKTVFIHRQLERVNSSPEESTKKHKMGEFCKVEGPEVNIQCWSTLWDAQEVLRMDSVGFLGCGGPTGHHGHDS